MNRLREGYIVVTVLGLLLLNSAGLRAQSSLYDSLRTSADTMHGLTKIYYLQNASGLFTYSSLDKGKYFLEESESLILELKNDSLLAVNYNLLGNLHLHSALFDEAEVFYNKALKIYQELNSYYGTAKELHNLGIVYKEKNDTVKCIDYFKRSLDASIETNNNRSIGDGLTSLGYIYLGYGEYDKSVSSLTRALDYFSDVDLYHRKYECYSYLTDNFIVLDLSRSLSYLKHMEEMLLADTAGILIKRHSFDFRMGQYYLAAGNYLKSAETYGTLNLDSLDLSDEYKPIESLRELSDRLFEIGEKEKAVRFSIAARNYKKKTDDSRIYETISEFKTRLNIRSIEEEIFRTDESNKLVLKRIQTERLLQYITVFILVLLSGTIIVLLSNFLNIRRAQVALSSRNIELRLANERSKAYKKSILRLRANKSVFFNILSDKLLIPFTDLTSRLTSLSENAKDSFNKKKFLADLGNIYTISISIEKSLKRILVWSKLQRKKYDVNREYITVNDYLHELLPEILKMAVRKNLKVSYDSDPGLSIMFDRKSLRSIIKVFIENSIDYSPKKSEILIRSKKGRNGGIISVTDFGKGIHPDIQKSLFDIKQRDKIEAEGDYKKLGLGLLISKHLAELNNSYISFESTLQKGSTFYLHIKKENGREKTDI